MIEGDDGSFELLAHGWLAGKDGDESTAVALVRSRNTDRVHLLVRKTDREPGTYTTGIGSGAIHSAACRIALLGSGARPHLM
jgi:hypothetical protein